MGRVGHVHGNMNSDNMALGGFALDYGPFGMMDGYDPDFSPWSDKLGFKYRAKQQAHCMQVNLDTLAHAFHELIDFISGAQTQAAIWSPLGETSSSVSPVTPSTPAEGSGKGDMPARAKTSISDAAGTGFITAHRRHRGECVRRKLGLQSWDATVDQLWSRLLQLMEPEGSFAISGADAGVDWHILFRTLTDNTVETIDDLRGAFYAWPLQPSRAAEWNEWLTDYHTRVAAEGRTDDDRRAEMRRANPKYVLRNWMMTLAYERADENDYSVVRELLDLLRSPYENQGEEAEKWCGRAPDWSLDTHCIS